MLDIVFKTNSEANGKKSNISEVITNKMKLNTYVSLAASNKTM